MRVAVEDDIVYLGTQEGGVRIISTETNALEISFHPIFIICNIFVGSLILVYKVKKKNYH